MHLGERRLLAIALELDSGSDAAAAHLNTCPRCRARLVAVRHDLARLQPAACPEPSHGLNDRILRAVQASASPVRPRPRWPALATGLAVLVLATAVWRFAPLTSAPVANSAIPTLQTEVARHVDRAQALLIEFKHAADAGTPVVNVAAEADCARDLLASNRALDQAARRDGDLRTAYLLESLEPALLQIAHAPSAMPAARWHDLQSGLSTSGVLFKLRVVDQTLAQNGAL